MLYQPKQIDLQTLAVQFANVIKNNPQFLQLWISMLKSAYITAIFSNANSNLTAGQTDLVINYAYQPVDVIVHRNGLKMIETLDYSITQNVGSFTITLVDPADTSGGATFAEIIEIQYY